VWFVIIISIAEIILIAIFAAIDIIQPLAYAWLIPTLEWFQLLGQWQICTNNIKTYVIPFSIEKN